MLNRRFARYAMALLLVAGPAFAGEDDTFPSSPSGTAPRFLVLVPERIDVEWFWYFYTAESQHLVQSEIEKQLLRGGFEVIDIAAAESFATERDVASLAHPQTALELGRAAGATHVVVGNAVAVRASHDVAYGVDVYRSAADVAVKILQVSDGKVVALLDGSAEAGAQSQRTAGRDALKDLGRQVGREVRQAAEGLDATR